MNALGTTRTLHPLQWVALISVTLFSLAGIGAITGLIPSSKSTETPVIAQAMSPSPGMSVAPVATTAEQPKPATAPVKQATEEVTPAPKPKVVKRPATVKQHSTQIAHAEPSSVVPPLPPQPVVCNECGHIESIQRIEHDGAGSGLGAAAGGVVGGVLGNNMGRGNGRTVATVAGVIGGALLGNHVEKANKKTYSYQTTVRLNDGSTRVFDNPTEQGLYEGERVRIVNGAIEPE